MSIYSIWAKTKNKLKKQGKCWYNGNTVPRLSYSPSSEAVFDGKKREDVTQCKMKETVDVLAATEYPIPTRQSKSQLHYTIVILSDSLYN